MRIVLSKAASAFLRHERQYLEQFNPRAASTVLSQIRNGLRFLAEYPEAGAPYEVLDGRRRFVSGSYVIDYRIKNDTLQVSRIRHGRQMPPELEKDGNLPDEGV